MHRKIIKITFTAILMLGFWGGSIAGSMAIAEEKGKQPVMPVRLDAEKIAGKNLEVGYPTVAKTRGNPREIISRPKEESRAATLFAGDVIVIVGHVPGNAKLRVEDTLYDEFIQIQEGVLILTPKATAQSERYVAGETLVLPKGFSGTWEMIGPFRELIVVETKTFTEDMNAE